MTQEQKRVVWGKVIHAFIRCGWNPPRPDDRVANRLLDALRLVEYGKGSVPVNATLELAPSEVRALALVAEGCDYREAAEVAGVEHETIKKQLQNARRRLGARNTAHAVALAFRSGVLDTVDPEEVHVATS